MDSLIERDGLTRMKHELRLWKPKPNSGSLLKDSIFLLALVFLQSTLLPALFGTMAFFDLLTPWLVITCVRQRPLQATLLCFIGAWALETRLAVPAGIYLCSYWILANVIFQFRGALSWRYKTPWFVSYLVSGLWVILFESFVIGFLHQSWIPDATFLLQQIIRLTVSVSFGMLLSREWMRIDAEEPVPQ